MPYGRLSGYSSAIRVRFRRSSAASVAFLASGLRSTAIRTFSRTVSVGSRRIAWNVRATPWRATWNGFIADNRVPSSVMSPALRWTNRETALISVVLPEPLGPTIP